MFVTVNFLKCKSNQVFLLQSWWCSLLPIGKTSKDLPKLSSVTFSAPPPSILLYKLWAPGIQHLSLYLLFSLLHSTLISVKSQTYFKAPVKCHPTFQVELTLSSSIDLYLKHLELYILFVYNKLVSFILSLLDVVFHLFQRSWVALSILLLHNSVLFSDSSKGLLLLVGILVS